MALQGADSGAFQLRQQLVEHGVVIGSLESIGADQPAAAGLLQGVLKFAEAVSGVDVDQHHADLRRGELGNAPLGIVR